MLFFYKYQNFLKTLRRFLNMERAKSAVKQIDTGIVLSAIIQTNAILCHNKPLFCPL